MCKFFRKMLVSPLTLTVALFLGTITKIAPNKELAVKATSTLSWGVSDTTLPVGTLTSVTSKMDTNWKITFYNATANAPLYSNHVVKLHSVCADGDGNEFIIEPTSTNTNKLITKFSIKEDTDSDTNDISVWVGNSVDSLTLVSTPVFNSGVYEYRKDSGFKVLKLKNTFKNSSSSIDKQFHFNKINLTYVDGVTATYEEKAKNSIQKGNVDTKKLSPLSSPLIISEAYGGGNEPGAPYQYDFIELYNTTNENIDLEAGNYHLYYYNPSSSYEHQLALSGTILANGYFLVQHRGGTTYGNPLPQFDQEGGFRMLANGFRIALTNSATPPVVTQGANDPTVLDYLGAGRNAIYYEGPSYSYAPNVSYSVSRKLDSNGVPIDTNNNNADFIRTTPNPQNSALSIVDYVMAEDTPNQCITRYPLAKAKMLATNQDQRDYFESHTSDYTNPSGHTLFNGRARYEAWATYLGDPQPYGTSGGSPIPFITFSDNDLNKITIIGLLGASLIAFYYFFIKKRRFVK